VKKIRRLVEQCPDCLGGVLKGCFINFILICVGCGEKGGVLFSFKYFKRIFV